MRLEASGETVSGTIGGGGVSCKVGGSLVAGKLRGWLRSEAAAGGAMHGNMQGALEGEAIRGTKAPDIRLRIDIQRPAQDAAGAAGDQRFTRRMKERHPTIFSRQVSDFLARRHVP